jgi:hypothetical protein
MAASDGSAANHTAPNTPEQRARRLELVLRELRKSAGVHAAPQLLLAKAVAGLEHELAAVRRQLGRR